MSAELSEAENTHSIESADSDLVRDRPGSLWIVWIILVPLIYVLSIGPAARLVAMACFYQRKICASTACYGYFYG